MDPSRDFFIGDHDRFFIGRIWICDRDGLLLKSREILFLFFNFFVILQNIQPGMGRIPMVGQLKDLTLYFFNFFFNFFNFNIFNKSIQSGI